MLFFVSFSCLKSWSCKYYVFFSGLVIAKVKSLLFVRFTKPGPWLIQSVSCYVGLLYVNVCCPLLETRVVEKGHFVFGKESISRGSSTYWYLPTPFSVELLLTVNKTITDRKDCYRCLHIFTAKWSRKHQKIHKT